jgi:hypothetical protein
MSLREAFQRVDWEVEKLGLHVDIHVTDTRKMTLPIFLPVIFSAWVGNVPIRVASLPGLLLDL